MRKVQALLLLLLLPLLLLAQSPQNFRTKPFVFAHVTVIDATGAPAKPDMTVVIIGNRIAALGETGKVRVPKVAQIVDATGMYLIPGLWDMHVHTGYKETYLPLYIANGITGVRDMGGDLERPTGDESIRMELLMQWRRGIAQGDLIGPHIVVSGPHIDGPGWPTNLAVTTASEGRQGVITLKR